MYTDPNFTHTHMRVCAHMCVHVLLSNCKNTSITISIQEEWMNEFSIESFPWEQVT